MQLLRFSARSTNLGMLLLLIGAFVTGAGCFLNGSTAGRWVGWLHAVAGCALFVLLLWKRRIIIGSLRRHGLGIWAIPSIGLLVLLALSLISGLLWSTTGLPGAFGVSGLTSTPRFPRHSYCC